MALVQNTSENIPIVDDKQYQEILEKMESPTKQEVTPTSVEKDNEVEPMETEGALKKEGQSGDKEESGVAETPLQDASVEEPVKKESPTKKEGKKLSPKESPVKKEEKKVSLKEPAKESPVKRDNRKEENQENVESAEQEDEKEEEHEQKRGIFDLPLEVEGKRERHKVERISYSTPTVKKSTPLKMGDGVPLGDIAYIDDQLKRHTADELQYLHRLIYGHTGKHTTIRREIRKFTGFGFEENSPEFKKKVNYLEKLTAEQLKIMKKILGIDTGGSSKEAIVTSVMIFMMKTVDHHRKVAGKKRKSTAKTPSGKRARKSKGSDEIVDGDEDEEEEREEKKEKEKVSVKRSRKSKGSDEIAEDDDEDEEEEKKKKKKEKEKLSRTPKAQKTPKISASTRKPRKKMESESKEASSKADSDSESGSTKKSKKALKEDSDDDSSSTTSNEASQENKPSEKELEEVIEELLATFDLAQVSMKQMCQAVIERFPGTNIGNRVDYLKSKIKQCLSTK